MERSEDLTRLTLIGIFTAAFLSFVSLKSQRDRHRRTLNLQPVDLALLGVATFRLGRLIAHDEVAEPLRRPVAITVPDETGAGESVTARGTGPRKVLGQLMSCPICVGTWIAAGLVYLLHLFPSPTRVFLTIMGTTGVAELLQALTEALSWFGQSERSEAGSKT